MTLAEAWEARLAERAMTPAQQVQARRDFYAGALAASAIPPLDVIRECIDFARTIGSPAERAPLSTTPEARS